MFFTPTHYGKKVDNFNEKEKKLLMVDTIMTTLFIKKKEGTLEKIEEIMMMSLGDKRTKIVLDILGWENGENSEERFELLERMENTDYGYSKFLKDMELNIKEHDRQEKISQMN